MKTFYLYIYNHALDKFMYIDCFSDMREKQLKYTLDCNLPFVYHSLSNGFYVPLINVVGRIDELCDENKENRWMVELLEEIKNKYNSMEKSVVYNKWRLEDLDMVILEIWLYRKEYKYAD